MSMNMILITHYLVYSQIILLFTIINNLYDKKLTIFLVSNKHEHDTNPTCKYDTALFFHPYVNLPIQRKIFTDKAMACK